jgi:hypothetical protein
MVKKKTVKKVNTKMKSQKCSMNGGCGGCAYFLGFIGSLVYYIQAATGFWSGVLGVLKAIVWPAMLAHGLLSFIGA